MNKHHTLEIIHMSFSYTYRVNGFTFDWHSHLGPTVLNRHTGEMRNPETICKGHARLWAAVGKFSGLSKDEREDYLV